MKRFYKHLSTWMFSSVFLFFLFFFMRIPAFVTLIAVGGWGMAVAAEAIDVFGFPGIDRDWEQRKIEEEMERMEPFEKREEQHNSDSPDDKGLELKDELDLDKLKELRRDWRDSDLV